MTGLILFSSFIFFTFYFLKKPWFNEVRSRRGVNEVMRSKRPFARTEVRSDFCNGDLSSAPKIFLLKRWGFRPNYFDKFTFTPAAIPWLTIGTFSLISALSISVGRAEYGVENAMISSRYTTTSILLIISLIYLFGLFLQEQQKYLSIYKIFAVVMTGIMMVNSVYVVTNVKSSFPYMESRKECLEIINYLEDSEFIQESQDSCLVLMNGKTWLVREGAEIMEKLGWRKFPQNLEFITETKETYGYLDYPQTTEKTLIINRDETLSLGDGQLDRIEINNQI
ncbi:hypothetical protein [Okeania sp. KiyG1]|uniref:hypothetical protein n=1 Tax=Okeania sp. KiyG1 TaxID=2720165 RepID=UPI00192372DF|nr:hypothetical protein [Okeania sp. KiyG1]